MVLQCTLDSHLDRRSLLALPSLSRQLVDSARCTVVVICLLKPLCEQGLELTHILKTQLQSLETANRGLAEHVPVQCPQRKSYVRLRKTELDSSLFELFGELFQVVRGRSVVLCF